MTSNDKESSQKQSAPQKLVAEPDPRLVFKCEFDGQSGWDVIKSIALATGEELSQETIGKFIEALKNTAGTENYEHAMAILSVLEKAMVFDDLQTRLNHIAALLPLTKPQDKIEAMLFGQFIALQESGLRQLGSANRQGVPSQQERSFHLATKLLNTANQTMQTLIKYRCRGQQTVQVIHMHNEGQAIVTQNLSHQAGGGAQKKSEN